MYNGNYVGCSQNPLLQKSLDLGVRIIRLARYLRHTIHDYDTASQLQRAGTSIGANIAEAQGAQSKADFIARLYISLKECYETYFWLELLRKNKDISESQYKSIIADAEEIGRLLNAVIVKTKANLKIHEPNN